MICKLAVVAVVAMLAGVPRAEAREAGVSIRAGDGAVPDQGTLRVTTDVPGAEVLVDGKSYGRTPDHAPIAVAPGEHQVVVRPEGGGPRVTVSVQLAAGEARTLNVEVSGGKPAVPHPALAVRASPPRRPVETWRRPAIWGTAGAAVLTIATAVVTQQVSNKKYGDFNAYRSRNGMCNRAVRPDYGDPICAEFLSAGDGFGTAAKVSLVASGVFAVSALVLWLTTPSAPAAGETYFACAPAVGGRQVGVGCATTF